jgi:hypothetical protein
LSQQSILLNIQPILDHDEDIIAAILENIQIGRLDDCVRHYGILQSNLMALSAELDNYPPCDIDLYSDVILNHELFPDEITFEDANFLSSSLTSLMDHQYLQVSSDSQHGQTQHTDC